MSQKVKILSAKVVGAAPFIGCLDPDPVDGKLVLGPAAPTWSSDPDDVMGWLAAGFRWRFNDRRAWRGHYAWEDDPDNPGKRRKVTDAAGEPILVALGNDPDWLSNKQVRVAHPHLAALPDMILQAPDRLENEEWFSAIERRKTLTGKGQKPDSLPRFRRRNGDARFVCWFNGGRNAVFARTGRRSGTVTITGMNPAQWSGGAPARWKVVLRIRFTQPVRAYTSIRVNWTRRELVFVNPPVSSVKKQSTGAAVGLDLGVAHNIATSDGDFFDRPNTADLDTAITREQKKLSKSRRINNPTNVRGWKPTRRYTAHQEKLARLHRKRAARVEDWQHKITTRLVNTHDVVVIEALNVKNMTKSAKGTIETPGKNVKAKAGLNRSLASARFGRIREMLLYKTDALIRDGWDQHLIAVNPKNTSRRCNPCRHTAKENRESQAIFRCTQCGHQDNADTNAACNVRDDGISILMGLDSQATVAGKPVAPAGSKRKTRPSVEDRALVPNGSCDEPQTTRHAAA